MLHGIHRDGDRPLQRAHAQPHIHELVGKQRIVFIVELRLQPQGAGGDVDLIVQRGQHALGQHFLLVAVPGFHRQQPARGMRRADIGELDLGHGEENGNGLGLGDGDDAVRIAAGDQIAGIDLAQAQPPADRRDDLRVGKLQLGIIHLGTVRHQRAAQLVYQRFLRVELLAGDGILLEQPAIDCQLAFRVLQLRQVLLQRSFRLGQAHAEGFRVDLGQHLARLDPFAFLEQHALQQPIDPAAHHHRIQRGHRADGLHLDRQILGNCRNHADRNRRRPRAGSTAAAGESARCRRIRRAQQIIPAKPARDGQQAQEDDGAQPATGRRAAGWRKDRLSHEYPCRRNRLRRRPHQPAMARILRPGTGKALRKNANDY